MRRPPVLAFSLLALLALSACATAQDGATDTGNTAPTPAAASEPAASAPAAAGGGCSESSEAPAVTVNIRNFAFAPAEATAKVGETIGWTNGDAAPHTATLDDDSCGTGSLAENATAGLVFDAAGTYPYHCNIHPNMTATITITE
jgi:plastocyanin